MKTIKKLAATLLVLMLICPCFANVAFAADGVAFFTDLETAVGDTFTVTGTVVAKNDVLGDATIELEYDSAYMRFVEGDTGVTDAGGTITFTGSGDGSSDRLTFDMTFQALQEGDTQMDQTGATVTTSSGATVNCTMGYAAISIAEGDPSKIQDDTSGADNTAATSEPAEGAIVVNGISYTISEVFSEVEVPMGFEVADLSYNGGTYKGISQATSGVQAFYLVNTEGTGSFFIYDETKNVFYPYEEIMISDTYSIVILDGTNEVKMPEKYVEASITINDVDFPVWVEPDREGFYIFYALNSDGEKSLYLYDSAEHTYQRMETPKTAESEDNEVSGLDKVLANVEDHLVWFLVGAVCAIIVLVILSIVLAVKLKHRNLELDDLYDEYGIDLDDEEKATDDDKDYFEEADDEYEDDDEYEYEDDDEYEYEDDDEYEYEDDDEYEYEDDDEYEYDDDDDYLEDDDLADLRRDFTVEKKTTQSNYDSYYDDDDFEDDDFVETSAQDKLRKDDTFEMNFIDLE